VKRGIVSEAAQRVDQLNGKEFGQIGGIWFEWRKQE
jgi:hypothetical protein